MVFKGKEGIVLENTFFSLPILEQLLSARTMNRHMDFSWFVKGRKSV
jgi:hypothetical protein